MCPVPYKTGTTITFYYETWDETYFYYVNDFLTVAVWLKFFYLIVISIGESVHGVIVNVYVFKSKLVLGSKT